MLVKSWKYINSSITGEKASCRFSWAHEDIFGESNSNLQNLSFN